MNIKEMTAAFICMLVVVTIISPTVVCSDAGPPDVITVKSLKEAENLMPVSGFIESILLEQGEVVISDSHFQIAPIINFYMGKNRPVSPDRFTIGTWVGAYLDELSRVKSLHLIDPPEGGNQTPPKKVPRQYNNQKEGSFYLENGVYKN